MGQPYVGEIRIFAGNFPPAGWEFCQGQLLAISENETLFQLIGTTYGGDGQTTFGLPDLQGRIPVHQGTGPSGQTYQLGEKAGVESVTLSSTQVPVHTHALMAASTPGTIASPHNAVFATHRDHKVFANTNAPTGNFPSTMVAATGGAQPHDNLPPYLCVNFIISLFGVFPSPT